MLIYLKTNFNYFNYYKINYSNYYFKFFIILKIFKISIFFNNIKYNQKYFFFLEFFYFVNIFYKNQFNILSKLIKKLFFKFSFNKFISNSSTSDILVFDENYNINNIKKYIDKKSFLKVLIIKKLNYLKLKKIFKFLIYWLPLKLINYYSLLNYSFGFKNNFINELHWFVIIFKNHKYLLKHHIS